MVHIMVHQTRSFVGRVSFYNCTERFRITSYICYLIYLPRACYFAFNVMASPDVAVFFPEINGNLTRVTWAHAVNNNSFLNSTLNNNDIMMIEADIVLGQLNGNGSLIPVMGHPPANTSDLSLEVFLDTIDKFNANATNNTTKKGVKLDFKSIESFNQSRAIVAQFNQGNYPIWINADILPGPINSTTTPVDATQFLAYANQFNNTVLSIGWTTNFGGNLTGSYSSDQVASMINVINQNNVTHNITFPVRAGLAAESSTQMKTLLSNVTRSTLTLWSSEGDNVNVTNLRRLIGEIGIRSIYIDVPEDLRSQLRLDNLPNKASALASTLVFSVFITAMILFM